METTTASSSRTRHGNHSRTGERADDTKPNTKVHHTSSHRSTTRYKEKFQTLREKYDQVTAKHDEYQRELEIASAKVKKLQAENDLLLDALITSASAQPVLYKPIPTSEFHMQEPTTSSQYKTQMPISAERPGSPNTVILHEIRGNRYPSQGNGVVNGDVNGVSRH